MHIADLGARRRIIGLSSPVATTAMVRSFSRPSASSRNSRTSRPRSPTRASTVVSKPAARASIDSSVDLPTPEPAKMPMRCPAQSGVKRSMARMPVFIGLRMRCRRMGAGGSRSVGSARSPCRNGPRPSIGWPSALIVRPFHEGSGLRVTLPRAHALVPSPASRDPSNGFTVMPCASMRTTSHSGDLPAPASSTHSPSRTKCDRPVRRQELALISVTVPPIRSSGPAAMPSAIASARASRAWATLSRSRSSL